MLICMGVFGPATPEDVRGALNTSFDDFSSWRKAMGLPCSQKRFTPRLLLKDVHGAHLSTKGFNARIIIEWIRDCLERVHTSNFNGLQPGRTLQAPVLGDNRLPYCLLAMSPGFKMGCFEGRDAVLNNRLSISRSLSLSLPLLPECLDSGR